jgi:fluoride exporter
VLGTFIVNVSGALVLGLFLGLTEGRWIAPPLARPAIAIGFLGAYTTFSTLMFESVDLAESGALATAFVNIIGSGSAGLLAVYAGLVVGRNV